MASFLSSLMSRDPRAAFGYQIPSAAVATVDGCIQLGNSAKKGEPEADAVSVFWGPPDFASLRVQTQKLKTMRHPNILTYVDSLEVDNTLYLVTERCVPLSVYMRDVQLTTEQRESVVSWGIYQVMSCLKFLHGANISHEGVRRAIYVTQAGDWKMAGLHKATAFTSPRADLNQLGLVLWELFNGFNAGMEKAEPPGKIPKKLHELYKRIATPAADKQTVAELLRELRSTGGYCKSRYVDTLLFLEEFQLKESGEKTAFFNQLRENLDAFPDDVAKYKILPRLIHTYEYGDAGPNILMPMFQLGKLLSEEEYQRRIVPCLVKLFGSPDRTTRVKLLEKIDDFAPHLTPATLNGKIYGNLSQGFLDSSTAVRESTVKAMVVLAEKLNSHNLNTDLMKYLAKLQGTDEHGGIRTNTTICLGKIAYLLDPSCRQKILIGAFTRGLKDPFPPARMASVLALSATQQFYALAEIANQVLPALTPLTRDPEKQVRDQAFTAIKGFIEKLEKASANPACIPELEAAVKAGGKGLLGSDKVPQWASKALKVLSGKFYKGPTPAQPGNSAAGAATAAGTGGGAAASREPAAGRKPVAAGATSAAAAASSGWDDEDEEWKDAEEGEAKGWEDEGWEMESKPPKLLMPLPATDTVPKPAAGPMQLGGLKPVKKNIEDELDEWLGISSSRKTSAASSTTTAAASSGGGWADFGDNLRASPMTTSVVKDIPAHRKKHDATVNSVAMHPSRPLIGSGGADALAVAGMASFLSSLISRDPRAAFGYEIPSTTVATVDGVQLGNSAKKGEPEAEAVSVFWGPPDAAALRVQTQKLKTMRHPNILTYVDSLEVDNTLYLVTERCVPLSVYMRDVQLTTEQRESVVSWGIYQVMSCLKFLHGANISHEGVRRAIYVTQAGDWKMAGLHKAAAFTSPRSDLNQLGLVLWELFNGFNEGMERAEPPGKIPKKLHELYKRIATPAAAKQTVAELLRELRSTGGYCKSRFVDTLLFLEEFQLKESGEKTAFFNQLRENLDAFPDDVAKYKILPRLIHTYEYGDAGPNILIPMFKLGRLLSEEEYQRRIVPCLVKLFGSPDRTTRVKLLEKIDDFAPHLTPAIVNEKIYGNLSQGFLDTSPAVRESTVKAMVVLAEKLNSHNLNTDLMKYLAKLQGTDEHGGIRTNTTICLGKIAYLLDPSCRQRILTGAFTRGLKDPFPPARMAAVLALSATQQFYALIEIANRVLPALSPLTCDPEKQVRDQAFTAIKGFIEKLEKASENPACIPELEAAVKAGGKGLLGSDKVPQWASWALKSLSGKFYKGPTPAQPGDPAAGAATAAEAGGGAAASSSPAVGRKPVAAGATSAAAAASSGWDDEDEEWKDAEEGEAKGWEDEGWEMESKPVKPLVKKPAAAAAPKPAASRMQLGGFKPTKKNVEDDLDELLGISSSRKTSAASSTATATGGGWDDFGDDLGASPMTVVKKSNPSPAAKPAAAAKFAAPAASDGWGDEAGDGWGEEAPAAPTPAAAKSAASAAAADKEARRAEMAARNEARKKELAAKRAARTGGVTSSGASPGGGAMKLPSTKQNPPPELDGDWGNDGW